MTSASMGMVLFVVEVKSMLELVATVKVSL